MSTEKTALDSLEAAVKAENEKLQKSATMTLRVYAGIIVVVLVYTSVVFNWIVKEAAPKPLAARTIEMAKAQVVTTRDDFITEFKANSESYAQKCAKSIVDYMPAVEQQIELFMMESADTLVDELENQIIPAFTDYIDADKTTLKDRYKDMTDDEMTQGVALLFIEVIEKELDKYINDEFVESVEDLQRQLHALAGASSKGLTRKQDAQRRVITCWSHLSETSEIGGGILDAPLKDLKEKLEESGVIKESD
jgi:hypothetical protein